MDNRNTTTVKSLALFAGLALTQAVFGQSNTTPLKRVETPTGLSAIYIAPDATLQNVESKLAQLQNENPSKLMIRVAIYESIDDEKETEDHFGNGHTAWANWKKDFLKQRSLASPMAEAVMINGYGLSRAYSNGATVTGIPVGLASLNEISCGQSKPLFLSLISGHIGPAMRNIFTLYFQWTGKTRQVDAECLANSIQLPELAPIELRISSDPFFADDEKYPRFNRFLSGAYEGTAQSDEPPNNSGPNYSCASYLKGSGPDCITIRYSKEGSNGFP